MMMFDVHIPDSVHAEMREETRPLVGCALGCLVVCVLTALVLVITYLRLR